METTETMATDTIQVLILMSSHFYTLAKTR